MKSAAVVTSIGVALGWSLVRHWQMPMGPSRVHWGGTVFGHRGCRHVPGTPENTLSAFMYAVSRGCGGVECDVRLTRDNEVVVFHDACANGQLQQIAADKPISDLTLFELKTCSFVDDPTGQIRVPTLEESVIFCRENNLRMLIEVKEQAKYRLCTDKVLELYRRYPGYMYEQTSLISFNPRVLYHARQRDRDVAVGQICAKDSIRSAMASGTWRGPWYVRACPRLADGALFFVQEKLSPWVTGCSLICPHYSLYSEAYRRRWLSRKIGVYLWGFPDSAACTPEMRQPGVCVSGDDAHEEFATPRPAPDFDIFGDRQRAIEQAQEEERKRLRLRS